MEGLCNLYNCSKVHMLYIYIYTTKGLIQPANTRINLKAQFGINTMQFTGITRERNPQSRVCLI